VKRARRPSEPDLSRETVGFRRRREKRERATAFLAGKPLLVGLDLAKKRHAVWLAKPDLTPIRRFMVAHSCEGLGTLLERVETERAKGGHDRALFFMEATSYFWANVANVLEARKLQYRLVSPLAVDRVREVEHLTYAKGDYRDAELIANLGHNGQWLARQLESTGSWREMRALAFEHELLLVAEIAERLRVRCLLGLAVPELFDYFQNPLSMTTRTIFRTLSRPATGLPTGFEALRKRLAQVEGKRLARSKIRALLARLEAGPLLGVEHALAPTLARAGFAVDRFDLLAEQRQDVRRRLVELYEATPYRSVLETIPGVTSANHALLLGLIADPTRYDRATCLVKLAGTEPRENHSGDAEGIHSISRRGQSPLRHLLYRIVCGLNLANEQFSSYLRRLRTRDQNPMAWHQAAVATGNKYLRVVYHMCVKKERYDPTKIGAKS
jgi:transposase